MSWSPQLFKVRGIPIRVHLSFLLILIWAAYIGLSDNRAAWWGGVGYMMAFVLLLFACVVLHELGHSLMAQLFGVQVQDITLWPIGGVARMAKMPERPYQEFLITAAGPATNIVVAFGLGIMAIVLIGPARLLDMATMPRLLMRALTAMNGESLLLLLMANNIILALFNLIPAFPMDGGRLLRSVLASFMRFDRATRYASFIGQGFALLMASAALVTGNLVLGIVGFFVFLSAWQERQQTNSVAGLRHLVVRQVMQPLGPRLRPDQSVTEGLALCALHSQAGFLVVETGRLVGLLARDRLLALPRKRAEGDLLAPLVQRDFLRFTLDESLIEARDRLLRAGASLGVVVTDGRAVGLLGQNDLARVSAILLTRPHVRL